MISTVSVAAVAALALLGGSANAHQRVTIPAPTFTVADRNTNWNPLAFLENQGVKVGEDILGYVKSKNAKNLREFMDNKANYRIEARRASFECGYTDPNGARQPIPANGMMRSTGYTHEGPCEIWIEDVMVKRGDNCHFDIGSKAVSYKIDFSVCKGNCMLRWYWFGNRLIGGKKRSWQIYKACIPLKGSGGGGRDATAGNKTSDVGKDESSPKTNKPTTLPATKTPASGGGAATKCKVKRA